jgi:hypothetical protein
MAATGLAHLCVLGQRELLQDYGACTVVGCIPESHRDMSPEDPKYKWQELKTRLSVMKKPFL